MEQVSTKRDTTMPKMAPIVFPHLRTMMAATSWHNWMMNVTQEATTAAPIRLVRSSIVAMTAAMDSTTNSSMERGHKRAKAFSFERVVSCMVLLTFS